MCFTSRGQRSGLDSMVGAQTVHAGGQGEAVGDEVMDSYIDSVIEVTLDNAVRLRPMFLLIWICIIGSVPA